MSLPSLRRLLMVLPVLACVMAGCRDSGWRRLDADDLFGRPLLRLPDDAIYHIASAPDGSVFVSTFRGHVYRRMPRGDAWTRVAAVGASEYGDPTLLTLHAFSARGFVGVYNARVYRWRAGQPLREEKTVLSDSTARCGDFTAFVMLRAAWGTEEDTYVVGDNGNVLHYRGGAWRLERTPLADVQPDLCYASYPVDLQSVSGGGGWVYAGAARLVRSRGDGRWEEVPLPGDSASVGALVYHDGALLVAVPRPSDEPAAGGRWQIRFYRPGRRPGAWTEAARSPWPLATLETGTAHPGGPAVFFGIDGGRIVVLEEGRARAWWQDTPGVRLRGAVPAGRDVLVALNDTASGYVVRLPR